MGGKICSPVHFKILMQSATVDSRVMISIIRANLINIPAYTAGVKLDVEKITANFTKNVN
jgi:hypothetical protein